MLTVTRATKLPWPSAAVGDTTIVPAPCPGYRDQLALGAKRICVREGRTVNDTGCGDKQCDREKAQTTRLDHGRPPFTAATHEEDTRRAARSLIRLRHPAETLTL